jgi:hypothetical protein
VEDEFVAEEALPEEHIEAERGIRREPAVARDGRR